MSQTEPQKRNRPIEREGGLGWTPEEDAFLANMVGKMQGVDWEVITAKVNLNFPSYLRSPHECKARWVNYLNKSSENAEWSHYEEMVLVREHRKHSNKWTNVSDALQGRNSNTCKNKFYSIFRKVQKKIQKRDFGFDSELELAEIYYILSIIMEHFAKPTTFVKMKGRRGKDFVYTLINKMPSKTVEDYKHEIEEKAHEYGNMDDIMKRLETFLHPEPQELKQVKATNEPQVEEEKKEGSSEKKDKPREDVIEGLNHPEDLHLEEFPLPNILSSKTPQESNDKLSAFARCLPPPHEFSPLFPTSARNCPSFFSPVTLSAGPAAAAAHGWRAPCFQTQNDFSDFATQVQHRAPSFLGDSPGIGFPSHLPMQPYYGYSQALRPFDDIMHFRSPVPQMLSRPPLPHLNGNMGSVHPRFSSIRPTLSPPFTRFPFSPFHNSDLD